MPSISHLMPVKGTLAISAIIHDFHLDSSRKLCPKMHQLDFYQQGLQDYSQTVIKRLSNVHYQTFNAYQMPISKLCFIH